MAWELIDNIRGPKGDKGDKGTINSISVATLPPESSATATMSGTTDVHVHFGIPRGAKGEQGAPGTLSSASAESVSAGDPAEVIMSGTTEVKHAHFKIPRGLPGVNAVENDAAVAAYVGASDSDTHAAVVALVDGVLPSTSTLNATDFGVVGDGVADDSDALNAAVAAVPAGGRLVIPAGTYRLADTIVNDGKALAVEARGARFVRSANIPAARFTGTQGATHVVTSLSNITIPEPSGGAVDGVELVLGSVPDAGHYSRGDVVKVVADDVLTGTRDAGDGSMAEQMRAGQFFTVYSYAGGVLTLQGRPIDAMTTNIRVAKYDDARVEWDGGTFDVVPELVGGGSNADTFELVDLVGPSVRGVSIMRSTGVGIEVRSCYRAHVDGLSVGWAKNDLAVGASGHAIANIASQSLRVSNLNAGNVRHGYSDNSPHPVVNEAAFNRYGRPLDTIVSDAVVDSSSGSSFDTHTSSYNTIFVNCVSRNSASFAIGLRGKFHSVIDCKVLNAKEAAVRAFTERWGVSHGHTIDGLYVDGATNIVHFYLNQTNTDTTLLDVRDSVASYVSNVHGINISSHFLAIENATVAMRDIYAACSVDGGTLTRFENSSVQLRHAVFDIEKHAKNSSGNVLFFAGTQNNAIVSDVHVVNAEGRLATLLAGSVGNLADIRGLRISDLPTSGRGGNIAGIALDYTVDNGVSSSAIVASGVTGGTTSHFDRITRTFDPVQTAFITPASAGTMAALPASVRDGVLLTVVNTSAFSVNVAHGGAVVTATGATVALGAGRSMSFVGFNGSWYHVSPV